MTSGSMLLLLLLLVLRIPVGIAMALAAAVLLRWFANVPVAALGQNIFSSIDKYTLVAIPLFIGSGALLSQTGMADTMINFFARLLVRVRGGLALAITAASTVFAAVSGSSVASTSALGVTAIPLMRRYGYDPGFAAALVATGGTLGLMIPPSLSFILIGSIAGIPVPDLFVAGIAPGLLQACLIALTAFWQSHRMNYGVMAERVDWPEVASSLRQALPVLLMPVFVLGGIYGGILSPTEAAGLSVLYAVAVGVLGRKLSARSFNSSLTQALVGASVLYLVVIGSNLFGFSLVRLDISQSIAEWFLSANIQPWMFLLMVNVLMLALGMVMDGVAMLLLVVPVLFPIAKSLGINPIHFAVLLTANAEIGTITPPVGLSLYAVSSLAGVSMPETIKRMLPFYLVCLIYLAVVTFVPELSLFLLRR